LIAIPDFPPKSIGNWGLIGFREETLLYSPEVSDVYQRQKVVFTISHQLAHQVCVTFLAFFVQPVLLRFTVLAVVPVSIF